MRLPRRSAFAATMHFAERLIGASAFPPRTIAGGSRRARRTTEETTVPMPRAIRYLSPLLLLLLTGTTDEAIGPRYTAQGALIPPADYREWVFLSSGLDMSYNEAPAMMGHSMFDNVFVDPTAWATFKRTGHWPDKTIFVMEVRGANSKGSINKKGLYQTEEQMGTELHVR